MSELNRFGLFNKIEGYSYIVLLFVAMPLKYVVGIAVATKIFGSIHGVLFILFCYQLFKIYSRGFITKKETSLYLFLSLIPFGSFYTEKLLSRRFNVDPISIKEI